MAPRRNPRRPTAAAAAATKDNDDPSDTTTPAQAPAPSLTSRGSRPKKTYESTPVPQQVTFPARRKIVRKYGGRRSLPARLETTTPSGTPGSSDRARRSLRQQTLTQIDYVRSSSGLGQEGGEGELLEDEEVEELQVQPQQRKAGGQGGKEQGGEGVGEAEVAKVAGKKKTAERRSKRRKTMGDVPTPDLERKGSSFHTQTLTQFLGNPASKMEGDGLRVEDEDEVEDDLPPPGDTPVKRSASPKKGKGRATTVAPDPHTPSNRRIAVDPYEVPSSQPTPFTPLLGHSPIMPAGSPLTQKSTNVDAPLPTIERVSKLPRTLVVQDSYSMGSSSVGFPSSEAGDTPKKKEEDMPSQQPKREPLAEILVASVELGVGSTPNGETPTARRKRMFVEIPDSDDELESVGSTPFKSRSTQQTPLKKELVASGFGLAVDSSPASRAPRAAISQTPASSGKSDKENESPAIRMWEDEDEASEGDKAATPTPTQPRKSQTAGRASQVSPNTASQFWTASTENAGSIGASGRAPREPLAELTVVEEPTVNENQRISPSPRASQFHGSMGGAAGKIRQATPQLEDFEETASEAEEEPVPVSILRKAMPQSPPRANGGKNRKSTPELNRSESSASEAPGTPTPIVRRVQIELPQSSAEEVCKETPRKPHKSSPIYQRHTQVRSQARSQFYSQGLESQRVPLEVIRSLGPQTDRSDILISIHAKTVEDIANGTRDHDFRDYKFPVQVSRCWIFTDLPVGEVKYMATLGSAQEPGEIDAQSGLGNAEFNHGTSGYKFAHKLLQVYQLNNPVPQADMEDNGLGAGPPERYKYLPPAIVGQLLMNLRCPLFAEGDLEHEDGKAAGNEGGATISQELEDQLRSDLIHSTQMKSSERRRHHHGDEYIIPASQSPAEKRSVAATAAVAARKKADDGFARPPVPARSGQRLRDHDQQSQPRRQQQQQQEQPAANKPSARSRYVRPSQATTASDMSLPSSQNRAVSCSPEAKLASVPRPPLPDSGGEFSLLSEQHLPRYHGRDDGGSSLLPLPLSRAGLLHLSSSQAGVLPPDSLLVDEGRVAPPPVEVWDSEEEEEEEEGY